MTKIFQQYMGTGLMPIWFVLALIYLFFNEKRKPMRILFLYTPAIVLLLFFNPLFYHLFLATIGTEIYFRICWLLPITAVIAYTLVHICIHFPEIKSPHADSLCADGTQRTYFCSARRTSLKGFFPPKFLFACTAIIILLASGSPVYSSPLYTPAENQYHVPQAVVDICDSIKVEGREVMAAFPDEFLLYVRQYSPVICMPYGRDAYTGNYNPLHRLMLSDEIDVEQLSVLSKSANCHYVIISEEKTLLGNMEDYGYQLFAAMHGYKVYKDTTMNFNL